MRQGGRGRARGNCGIREKRNGSRDATGVTGYPFFGDLILDSLNRTENAMTQARAFKAAELCLIAQKQAEMVYQAK